MKGIYSKRCWLDGELQEATVYFENSVITKVVKDIPTNFHDVENVSDSILMPGVIDAHVHINEPGRTDWEGFDTGTSAAAAGGITTLVDMPLNSSPVTTSAKAFKEKLAASEGKLHVNVGFYGGMVPGNFDDLEDLIKAGVLGIKAFLTHSGIDEFPNVGEQELNKAAPLLAKYQVPLLAHCELTDTVPNNRDENPQSYRNYLDSRPKKWENDAVALMIEICRRHHNPVHIVHVSSAEALNLIREAKADGLPITAETCPHYIYFNAEGIPDAATIFKCAPPVREKDNNKKLKSALEEGVLDFLATDHSPAPPEMKHIETGDLKTAWGGIAGLQFLLPSGFTALKEIISIEQFIPLLTEHPAKFLKADSRKGFIREGYDADLVVWSPKESFTVKEENILHKHKISPYVGEQLYGVVKQTYVDGELIFNGQNIVQKNKGKWLLRK